MGPGRRSGSAQDAGDVIVGVDNLEDAHAAAALAANGDVDGEHASDARMSCINARARPCYTPWCQKPQLNARSSAATYI